MKENKIINEYVTLVSTAPSQLLINSELEWSIKLTANKRIPKGMSIRITVPAYQHQRSEEYLQNYDYWKPNYIYAMPSDDKIKVKTSVEKVETSFSHIKSWVDSNRVAVISVHTDIKKGEGFTVGFGGINKPFVKGECTPSRCGQFAYFNGGTWLNYRVEVDYLGNGNYIEEKILGPIKILPEKASKMVITSDNSAKPNEMINASILVKDRFNNPIFDYDYSNIALVITNLKTGWNEYLNKNDGNWSYTVKDEGFYEITAENTDLECISSVVYCAKDASSIYWGDTHVHSNLTPNIRDNDGGATPAQCYWYSKNVSKIDFVCLVEQTFQFDENSDVNIDKDTWKRMIQEAGKHCKENEFIPFSGFEMHGPRGDTVVFFQDELTIYDYPDKNVKSIPDVWDYYKDKEFMTVPHLHRYCNGRPNLDQQDKNNSGFDLEKWESSSENEVLCEVFSSQWGTFENQNSPKVLKALDNVKGNTVAEFLNKGKTWGMTASSDGHDGNPGYGGLTGVFANGLTRDKLFSSLKGRNTIATTHARVVIDFKMNGNSIGEVIDCAANSTVNINVVSPESIDKVQIIKNGNVYREYIYSKKYANIYDDIEDVETNDYFYVKVLLEDNDIAWTSPIFCR